ncbi:hypothetical protein GF326_11635 [Candidatus Bathyarchaeota archaeon]|nr:hypothetical protein [Candidatus Bathyarchaeota archaeon]
MIPVTLNLDSHCTMNINASEIGQWTMQMSSIPLLVNQSKGYVETSKTEASFTVVEAPNMDLSTDTCSTYNNLGNSIPGYLFGSLFMGCAALLLFLMRRDYTYQI